MRMPTCSLGSLGANTVIVEVTCDIYMRGRSKDKLSGSGGGSGGDDDDDGGGRRERSSARSTLPAFVAISRCSSMLMKSCSGESRCRMSRTIMFFQLIRPMHLVEFLHANWAGKSPRYVAGDELSLP